MSRSILVLAPYLPVPATFGGALRIFHLVRGLAEQHQVILLAPGGEDEYAAAGELSGICDVTVVPASSTARQPAGRRKRINQAQSVVSGRSFLELSSYSAQYQAVLERIFMTRSIDLVQLEFPESALYHLPRPVPTVFDAHNVEHDLLHRVAHVSDSSAKRTFNLLEARKLQRIEVAAWNGATRCVVTSQRDARLIGNLSSTPVDVVPNGVDLAAFDEVQPMTPTPQRVVFVGAMRHQPNADGARWYVQHVHPLVQQHISEASVAIVGADPPATVRELAGASVHVTGAVDDVRPYLGAARAVVAPLWSGGGTRLKILEAFASGRPVVSTTIGAEGIGALHGEHLLLADTPVAFARAVVQLLTDSTVAARLAAAGRALVERQFGWDHVTRQLIATHHRAIEAFDPFAAR